jgi:hypothetical protein
MDPQTHNICLEGRFFNKRVKNNLFISIIFYNFRVYKLRILRIFQYRWKKNYLFDISSIWIHKHTICLEGSFLKKWIQFFLFISVVFFTIFVEYKLRILRIFQSLWKNRICLMSHLNGSTDIVYICLEGRLLKKKDRKCTSKKSLKLENDFLVPNLKL